MYLGMQVSILIRDGSDPQIYRILFRSVGGRGSQALSVTLSIIKRSWIELKTDPFSFSDGYVIFKYYSRKVIFKLHSKRTKGFTNF